MTINKVQVFYESMILPKTPNIYNPQFELLNKEWKKSMEVLRETIDSVHSKTLDELYTDEFRPSVTQANKTTIKSLVTGKPVDIDIKYMLEKHIDEENTDRLKYYAHLSDDGGYLGSKTFGIQKKDAENKFESGFIRSAQNKEYSGVQIRLLQAACEEADKKGIKSMPLLSLLPSVKFHTMMGFRPKPACNEEIRTLSDISRATDDFCRFHTRDVHESEVVPILNKVEDRFYFDSNRTLYCATMKHNQRLLENRGARNMSLSDQHTDSAIDMELSGEEYEKWLERIKGFEIMPENGAVPQKMDMAQKLKDIWYLIRYGG